MNRKDNLLSLFIAKMCVKGFDNCLIYSDQSQNMESQNTKEYESLEDVINGEDSGFIDVSCSMVILVFFVVK